MTRRPVWTRSFHKISAGSSQRLWRAVGQGGPGDPREPAAGWDCPPLGPNSRPQLLYSTDREQNGASVAPVPHERGRKNCAAVGHVMTHCQTRHQLGCVLPPLPAPQRRAEGAVRNSTPLSACPSRVSAAARLDRMAALLPDMERLSLMRTSATCRRAPPTTASG